MSLHKSGLGTRILAACAVALTVLLLLGSVMRITRVKPAMGDFNSLPRIVIDPGHGGSDGGAVANGVVEEEVNLAISLVLRDMFALNGFEVVMTRDTDISIHDPGIKGAKKQKTSDLKNRRKIMDEKPDTIFISIHQNAFTSSRSWGTQIFYGPENPNSERLATILQQDFGALLQPENERESKKAGKNLYLMTQAKCPAVLVECGFLSNSGDAAKLNDPEYQRRVAFTVLCSTLKYLEEPV